MKPQGMSEVASRQLATVHIAGETANPIRRDRSEKDEAKGSGGVSTKGEKEKERESE